MYNRTPQQNNMQTRGFTLLDVLLYLAISAVVVSIMSGLSIELLRLAKKTELMNEVQYTQMMIQQTLIRSAADAYDITEPVGSATSSAVTFRMYDASLDPTIMYVVDGVSYLRQGEEAAMALHSSSTYSELIFSNATPENGYAVIIASTTVGVDVDYILSALTNEESVRTTLTLHFTP